MDAIEKRARELLAAEVDRDAADMPGVEVVATSIREGGDGGVLFLPTALRAVIAALTRQESAAEIPKSVPEGFVLVDMAKFMGAIEDTCRRRAYDLLRGARPEVP
nr:hypothetical protein [Stenotrophomonas geniculata]